MADTTRTEISEQEYTQLAGLLAMGQRLEARLHEIERAVLGITGEGDYGHGSDVLYNNGSVDDLVRKLGVDVLRRCVGCGRPKPLSEFPGGEFWFSNVCWPCSGDEYGPRPGTEE